MVAPTTGPLPKMVGPYIVTAKLGSGGMATVYRANHSETGREVALKVLAHHLVMDESIRRRFEREAHVLLQFRHPHILPVYDYGEDGDTVYLVMKLLRGESLSDLLKNGPLPVERVGEITRQVASALDYAHAHNIIHRDIKPRNILLDETDSPYLADFGVAFLSEAGDDGERLTSTGEFLGTPAYASPEQCRGEPPGRPSDIYSLAAVVFEMATGRQPFEAASPLALIKMHLYDKPPNPVALNPRLPIELYHVLVKALAKDPPSRYESAMKFSEAVDQALGLHAIPQADDSDDWLHDEGPIIVPKGPSFKPRPRPETHDFLLEGELLDDSDPFEGITVESLDEAADQVAAQPFDDRFDVDDEFPETVFADEPLPDDGPGAPRPVIHAIGTPPIITPRRPLPWLKISVYSTIAISLLALLAAAIIGYREFIQEESAPLPGYQSTELSLSLTYPAGWVLQTGNLAVLSAQALPVVLLSDTAPAPGGSARVMIAVQRINPVDVFRVPPACRDQIPGGPVDTFDCMKDTGYATPVYRRFDTKRYRAARLPGTLPPEPASLPVVLLSPGRREWIAVTIVYWDGYQDAQARLDEIARSVRAD